MPEETETVLVGSSPSPAAVGAGAPEGIAIRPTTAEAHLVRVATTESVV